MSNQSKTGDVTSLEQVFLSREFALARDRQALLHDRTLGAGLPALEQVLLSDHFGRRRDLSLHVTQSAETVPAALSPESAVLTVLPSVLRENNRHRAVAAVSGIAAAALVVAGLASGGAPQRQGDVSAQGPHASSHPPFGGRPGSPVGLSSGSEGAGGTLAASSGSSGAPHAFLTGAPAHTGTGQGGPPPAVTVEVPPGTTVTVVPSPSAPQRGPTGSGTGGATGSPAPAAPATPAPASPTAPVVVVVGNTVTTVGTTVTTATGQVGSSLPTVAPATGALDVGTTGALGGVGATVTGLTQGLNATTA